MGYTAKSAICQVLEGVQISFGWYQCESRGLSYTSKPESDMTISVIDGEMQEYSRKYI